VVVDDLEVFGSRSRPAKADPPLSVDPDAVGIGAVTLEFLEPVAWWDPEVVQAISGVEDQ
jgi:hypothetical protein